ncbi:DUF1269 domain-containing protein [Brachybacterium saurashtrense]|uniref:DUF1269 domain-containing protein n=1 Tax=Brachybacterium saurashtrense TaxID=556288 RepID=A0A345YLW7_9MICO|nr:DUF1269 domain-containing protein [Brachybacterium saurashtrense]AXK44919.1 DUF1269 domain-containing protein [Brachybacterium saurashtrense]RRR21603.1 DUF1269 domain-containing protein [Brachybacterium saurashtrense]
MATFTVWKFDDPSSADVAVEALNGLQKEELIRVLDSATVSWKEGKKKPKTRQVNLEGAGAAGGGLWGLLFGLLFFVPLLGAAVGAAAGALAGKLSDVGIDDDFIKEVRNEVTEGTSAVFLLTEDAVQDKVRDALSELQLHPHLIHSNLSNEQEFALRLAFID